MWVEIICGVVVYKLWRWFVKDNEDEEFDRDISSTDVNFVVSDRIEKSYGGKVFLGLRIPDSDSGVRQNVDLVHVTKGEMAVVIVRNLKGVVELGNDGSWICTNSKGNIDRHADPVQEMNKQLSVLDHYLEKRGVVLPKGFLKGRIILPNPDCRVALKIKQLPEVISFEEWCQVKPESKAGFPGWVKDAFLGPKTGPHEELIQKIHFILSSAPMWDRLELSCGKHVLGEFKDFKGKHEDMQALKNIKRSKVSKLAVQKTTLFRLLGKSELIVQCVYRDYRNGGSSERELKEISVRSKTELLFEPLNSRKVKKFKLSKIEALTLGA